MKSRGVPDRLKNTTPKAKGGGIPASADPVIKGMTRAAQDGRTAGDEGERPRHPPGSQRKNIPGGVGDLIAPPGYVVL